MAPVLPASLSPHICVLPSPDLTELLASSSLPPLPQILQSFSPLPQVTTRTTALTSVPHASFALRFSDLVEIETACREDEEQRAARTIDWIGARVANKCAKWVEDMQKMDESTGLGTPWWDELRRCVEGDHVPSRVEGWNHPVAIISAVSTMAPNPLQAITALHSRVPEFPPWVDPAHIRCTLIIHPQNSSLSDEEAGALFNAVKKQFGLHSYFLPLTLPSPPPPPVPIPAIAPRLPRPTPDSDSPRLGNELPTTPNAATNGIENHDKGLLASSTPNELRMCEQDIQQTARFAREFVVMSLVPWMEKCVVDWNENYSSTRRLPSRLFSSTRRLFGTSSPLTPSHTSTPSIPSPPSQSHTYNGSQGSVSDIPGGPAPPPQLRRLAEFATMIGDYKLAVGIWESLRKEGKGGSEILPLLLAPAPTVPLHVSHALSTIHPPTLELPAHAQLRALIYAVRWEIGIGSGDFLDSVLEGERWLVWAAGNAEEPPSALLLAHAALLSFRKHARRRAALWYLFAANRLEKCGIKPLTMYFLRRAHDLYMFRPEKSLSPSFWESEGKKHVDLTGFDAIIPGIEHPLGRLLYTTGDVTGAVRLFIGLLRGATPLALSSTVNGHANGELNPSGTDKVFLEDFRVAFKHFQATMRESIELFDLKLPFTFCLIHSTKVRLPRDSTNGDEKEWEMREEDWNAFWRTRGTEVLENGGKAMVDETFWVDLVLQNPLDTEVNLANLTVSVREASSDSPESGVTFVEVETLDEVILRPKEIRTIPVAIKSSRAASLVITHLAYEFLSLLKLAESLGSRGPRLHETVLQRQNVMYAPDVLIRVDVADADQRLLVDLADDGKLVMAQGECKQMKLWLSNKGARCIRDVWLVTGPDDQIWVDYHDTDLPTNMSEDSTTPEVEVMSSDNSLAPPRPHRIPLGQASDSSTLKPGENAEVSVVLHAERIGGQRLCLLFVFREGDGSAFRSARVTQYYEVQPILEVTATASPSRSLDHLFLLNIELESLTSSSAVQLTQITALSPTWECMPVAEYALGTLSPFQSGHIFFGAKRWSGGSGSEQTLRFVSRKLQDVLHGRGVEISDPPSIDLLCTHATKSRPARSVCEAATRHFIQSGRRDATTRSVTASHQHIPASTYPYIFPLYNPACIDIIVFWEMPSQQRSGHLFISGITLGAGHAALQEIIEDAEGGKVKRSMYAETRREKMEVLEAIRGCEWNMQMNSIVVTLQDGNTIAHDFREGPCQVLTSFTLRNYSLTHASRYVLKLPAYSDPATYPPSFDLLHPPYSGRTTFRGELGPSQQITLRPKLWITRPGTYALDGWRLESEVGEQPLPGGLWRTRHTYVQGPPPGDRSCVTIYDDSRP